MIRYQCYGLTIVEDFFCRQDAREKCDLMRCIQVGTPEGLHALHEQTTRLIALGKPLDEILAGFDKGCRYEIRRAINNAEVTCVVLPSDQITDDFLFKVKAQYDKRMVPSGVSKMNLRRLSELRKLDQLVVTNASRMPPEGFDIFHLYLRKPERARLLYSFAETHDGARDINALVGRGNRLLHWMDIRHFKETGVTWYDIGGIYTGKTDEKKMNIRRFKDAFAGDLVREFSGYQACSMKGRLAVMALDVLRRWRGRDDERGS